MKENYLNTGPSLGDSVNEPAPSEVLPDATDRGEDPFDDIELAVPDVPTNDIELAVPIYTGNPVHTENPVYTERNGIKVRDFRSSHVPEAAPIDQEKIDALKLELNRINTAVQESTMGLGEAEERTKSLESQIYELDGSSKLAEEAKEAEASLAKEEMETNLNWAKSISEGGTPVEEKVEGELDSGVVEEVTASPEEVEKFGEQEIGEISSEKVVLDKEKEAYKINPEQKEYLRLKREFKSAEQKYYDAISEDYATRDHVSKLFGTGRNNMNPSVREAYDKFVEAEKVHIKYGKESGIYQNISNFKNSSKTEGEEEFSINAAIAKRHILNPAEKRLELQTTKLMPEKLSKFKDGILNHIKKNPKTALTVGALALGIGGYAAGAVATGMYVGKVGLGFATRYLGGWVGEKTLVKRKEDKVEGLMSDATLMAGELDEQTLEKYEKEIYEALNSAQRTKTGVKVGARVAGGLAVGAAFSPEIHELTSGGDQVASGGVENGGVADQAVSPEVAVGATGYENINDEAPVPDNWTEVGGSQANPEAVPLASEAVVGEVAPTSELASEPIVEDVNALPESNVEIELTHEIMPGENISTILLDGIRERFEAGELELPPHVTDEGLSNFMYRSFPELTNATDISPTVSLSDWQELGIDSGNPHSIQPGETIDVQGLIDRLPGGPASIDLSSVADAVEIDVPEDLPVEDGPATWAQFSEYIANESGKVPVDEIDVPVEPPTVEEHQVPVVESVADTVRNEAGIMESVGADPDTDTVIESEINPDSLEVGESHSISTEYAELTHKFTEGEGMHTYLAKTIEEGVANGDITLPSNMTFNDTDFSNDMLGFVQHRLPDVSKSFFMLDIDVFSPDQWKELGISGGDPTRVNTTDVFDAGKVLQYILSGDPGPIQLGEVVNSATEVDVTAGADVDLDVNGGSHESLNLNTEYKVGPLYAGKVDLFITDMKEKLVEIIEEGIKDGGIVLPEELTTGKIDYSKNIGALIDQRLPRIGMGNWDKIKHILARNENALTFAEWREVGVSSGNPQQLANHDIIQTGKLIEYVVSGNRNVLVTKP